MKSIASRLMLALAGGLLWAGPAVEAKDVQFSDLESRPAVVKQGDVGTAAVAYVSDEPVLDAIAPNEPIANENMDFEIGGRLAAAAKAGGCASECCQQSATCESPDDDSIPVAGYFAQAEFMLLRPNVAELAAGKLSERYELAPRLVLGYESAGGVGGRVRYWTYGRTTEILNDDADIRFEFDVYDVEATSRFRTRRSELVVGGGFRLARLDIDLGGEGVGNNLAGLTLAADLRTYLCGDRRWEWSAVCGARFSMLYGDWEGGEEGLVAPVRDDNVVTQELYGGLEYTQRLGTCNVFTRLVFEMQNWHSDALAQTGGTDSIGMIGPGVQVGATY